MHDVIADIRGKMAAGSYANEDQVSKGVVLRLLQTLGWNIFDPAQVSSEFPIANRKVDYALRHHPFGPVVLVEVKGVGKATGAGEDQLFDYCSKQGVPLAVLTDGATWSFYFPAGMGTYEQRRFAVAEIANEEHCVRLLRRYLGFEAVTSGSFRSDAQRDYDAHRQQIVAGEQFEAVFVSLVTEAAPALVDLFRDEVERRAQIRPSDAHVRAFLRSRTAASAPEPRFSGDQRKGPPGKLAPGRSGPEPPTRRPEPGTASFTWFGETVICRNDTEVFVGVMTALGKRDPGAYQRIAPELAGRTRGVLARERSHLYPPGSSNAVRKSAEPLPGGWWLGTHSSSAQKEKLLARARELAGFAPRDCSWRLKGKV